MKKILAFLLVIAISFCLIVPTFAIDSPTADSFINVTFFGVSEKVDGYYIIITNKSGNEILRISADPTKGEFNSWSFYVIETDQKGNQKFAEAKLGENINIKMLDGENKIPVTTLAQFEKAIKEKNLEIEVINAPTNSIIVCGNYDNTFTSPVDGKRLKTKEEIFKLDPETGKTHSPQTGDNFNGLLLLPIFSLAGIVIVSKKIRSVA